MAEAASLSRSSTDTLENTYAENPYGSACGIYKQSDACILTCDRSKCYAPHYASFISLSKGGNLPIDVYSLKMSEMNRSEEQESNAVIFAIFVCKHNQKHFEQCWRRLREHSIVVLGSIGKIKSELPECCYRNIERKENMLQFYYEIKSAVLKNRDDNVYHEIDSNSLCEMKKNAIKSDQRADRKHKHKSFTVETTETYKENKTELTIETTDTYNEDKKEHSSHSEKARDVYLDVQTLLPSQSHLGSFVFQSYILPMENYDELENKHPEDIVSRYNEGRCKNSIDFEKYIGTTLIKKCVDGKYIHGLVKILSCQKRRIQLNAFRYIEKMLYSLDVRLCNTQDLLHGITDLLSLVELWSGDQELLLLLLNSALTMLIILFMSFNARVDVSIKNDIRDVCKNAKEKMNKVEHLHDTDEILTSAFDNLRKSAECFCDHLETVSVLRMGNWSDAMKKNSNREKIIKDFPEMSELEQSTVIFGLLNQVMIQAGGNQTTLFNILCTCIETTLNIRRKDNITIFPMLQLTTKMMNMALETSYYQAEETMNVFSLYLDDVIVHQSVRKFLLKEIECLLFHKDKLIVNKMFSFMSKIRMHLPYDLRQITVSHVEKSLQPLDISIDSDTNSTGSNTISSPQWTTFKGAVNNKNVSVHILIPSKDCIMKGIMEDYRKNSTQKDLLKEHEQQRDVLYLLCREGKTPLVLPLVAFQCRPLPPFYITLQDQNSVFLSDYLLSKRNWKDWVPFGKLCTMAADILNAVKFLHSRDIIHRGLTASCFSVREDGSVYLSNLVTASDGHLSEFIAECTRQPLRWSAPESILYDKYSKESDVYMVGQLLYELFTHGCHPYTELYGYSLDYVLELIVFQNLKPRQWPCIPKAIHEVILHFVNYDSPKRRSLINGLMDLNNILLEFPSYQASRKRLSQSHKEDLRYPDIDPLLPKEPQTELPTFFQQIKNQIGKTNPSMYYENLGKSKRRTSNSLAISEADITSSEVPYILKEDSKLIVDEPVSEKFFKVYFTDLSESPLQETLNILNWPPSVEKSDAFILHFTTCVSGESLSQLSLRRCFGDPDDQENKLKYSWIVHLAVHFIGLLHERNWILRDICCQNLYLTSNMQKVFSTKLGRMAYLRQQDGLDDSIIDEIFFDRKNWFPLEVLQHKQYSKEGDVYMLAMAIYEFYMGLQINLESPVLSYLNCIPFCKIPKDELTKHLLSGEVPQQPIYCPDELYEIMVKCWNRDRTRRPTCSEFLQVATSLVKENAFYSCYIHAKDGWHNQGTPPLPPRSSNTLSNSTITVPCNQKYKTNGSIDNRGIGDQSTPQYDNVAQRQFSFSQGFDRMDSKRSNFRRVNYFNYGSLRKSRFESQSDYQLCKNISPQGSEDNLSIDSLYASVTSATNSSLRSSFSLANKSSDSSLSLANANSDSSFSLANKSSEWSFPVENASLDSDLSIANLSSSDSVFSKRPDQTHISVTTLMTAMTEKTKDLETVTLDPPPVACRYDAALLVDKDQKIEEDYSYAQTQNGEDNLDYVNQDVEEEDSYLTPVFV